MQDKRFALLIDADNISSKYIKYILDELVKYGSVTYKRIYGDWTKTTVTGWKDILLRNSISPIQQYSYTVGKNATDSAMIIDAMDILYSGKVDGFCLTSSDSDFTRLAIRLRESGMMVIGMGEKKTPEPFRTSCERFVYLDLLSETDDDDLKEKPSANSKAALIDGNTIERAMVRMITENGNDGKDIGIAELGSRLIKLYPDFDVRNFGYTKLSKYVESFPSLKLVVNGNNMSVELQDNKVPIEDVKQEILTIIEQSGSKGMNLGDLNQKLQKKIPEFDVRTYEYSKFSKLLQEIPGLKIKKDSKGGAQTVTRVL